MFPLETELANTLRSSSLLRVQLVIDVLKIRTIYIHISIIIQNKSINIWGHFGKKCP